MQQLCKRWPRFESSAIQDRELYRQILVIQPPL